MDEIDWEKIYSGTIRKELPRLNYWGRNEDSIWADIASEGKTNKKFDHPIAPIPWRTDFHENVALTLEWLVRDHRKDKLRLKQDKLHEHTREFWFHNEYDPGMFKHVCFPKDILSYRMQYDGVYELWSNLPASEMSSQSSPLLDKCKQLLWYQWKCTGGDGFYKDFGDGSPHQSTIGYRYQCSRCGMDMPKGVRMFTMLTQTKLKDI